VKIVKTALLLFLFSFPLFSSNARLEGSTVLFLPFENHGDEKDNHLCELIPNLMHLFFKKISLHSSISAGRLRLYMETHDFKRDDLENIDTLYQIAADHHADYIFKGGFCHDDDIIQLNVEVIDISLKRIIYRSNNKQRGGIHLFSSLSKIILKIIKGFKKIQNIIPVEVNHGFLMFKTDRQCMLTVNDEIIGETPFDFCFPEGNYHITLMYQSPDITGMVYEGDIVIVRGEKKRFAFRVLINLVINAEKKCSLFLNEEFIGTTPYEGQLVTGSNYLLTVVYKDTKDNDVIITKEILFTKEEKDISLFFPVTGSIIVKSRENNLKAAIDGESLLHIPCKFEHIPTGTYRFKVILQELPADKNWLFYRKTINLVPEEVKIIDLTGLDYQKLWGLCFIPSAAQFYNRETNKGTIILSLFLGSAASAGISAFFASFFHAYYWEKREAGAWEEEVHDLYLATKHCETLFYFSIFSASFIYLYSFIDGLSTMNHIYYLFHNN
jgi:hypothetical protein